MMPGESLPKPLQQALQLHRSGPTQAAVVALPHHAPTDIAYRPHYLGGLGFLEPEAASQLGGAKEPILACTGATPTMGLVGGEGWCPAS